MRLEGSAIKTSPVLIYTAREARDWSGWVKVVKGLYPTPGSMPDRFRAAALKALVQHTSWDGRFDDGPYLTGQPSSFPGLPPAMMVGVTSGQQSYYVTMTPLWIAPTCLLEPPNVLSGLSWSAADQVTPVELSWADELDTAELALHG